MRCYAVRCSATVRRSTYVTGNQQSIVLGVRSHRLISSLPSPGDVLQASCDEAASSAICFVSIQGYFKLSCAFTYWAMTLQRVGGVNVSTHKRFICVLICADVKSRNLGKFSQTT